MRELISNSADALEKYRVLSLTQGLGDYEPLNVTIRAVPADGRLVIADSGIGMSREELQTNLSVNILNILCGALKCLLQRNNREIRNFGVPTKAFIKRDVC